MGAQASRAKIHGVEVLGLDVDPETRCHHWASPLDVIALKFKCCATWYPCHDCHTACADHEPAVWPLAERDERAVLCGVCGHQLTITEYLGSGSRCPACQAAFNPGCALHYDLYFEVDPHG